MRTECRIGDASACRIAPVESDLASVAGATDPETILVDRDQRSCSQRIAMKPEYLDGRRALLTSCQVHQTHDAMVRCAMKYRQLSKVLVERHQDSALPVGDRQDLRVAGIRIPVAAPHHIVPGLNQRLLGAAPDTRVQQDLHDAAAVFTTNGSTRSRATIRRAYTRQASMSARSSQG